MHTVSLLLALSVLAPCRLLFVINRPTPSFILFFFNDTATTEIYTLSLHDALPILQLHFVQMLLRARTGPWPPLGHHWSRSEEHTSELQSRPHLVCRLLLEKKNQH